MDADPEGGRVEIKLLNPGQKAKVAQAALRQRIVYDVDTKGMRTEQDLNPQEEVETFSSLVVTNWENFFDGKKPLQYTRQNVVKAVREIEGLAEFIRESYLKLESDVANELEEQEKN